MLSGRWGALRQQRDGGFTLVELLVVIAILGVIGTITMAAIVNSLTDQRKQRSRLTALTDTQTSLQRMSRELRTADPVTAAAANDVTAKVYIRGACESHRWYVSGGKLSLDVARYADAAPCATTTAALGATRTQVVAGSIANDAGSPLFGFARLDPATDQMVTVAAPVTAADLGLLKRISVSMKVNLKYGQQPVVASTSVDLRNVE